MDRPPNMGRSVFAMAIAIAPSSSPLISSWWLVATEPKIMWQNISWRAELDAVLRHWTKEDIVMPAAFTIMLANRWLTIHIRCQWLSWFWWFSSISDRHQRQHQQLSFISINADISNNNILQMQRVDVTRMKIDYHFKCCIGASRHRVTLIKLHHHWGKLIKTLKMLRGFNLET